MVCPFKQIPLFGKTTHFEIYLITILKLVGKKRHNIREDRALKKYFVSILKALCL